MQDGFILQCGLGYAAILFKTPVHLLRIVARFLTYLIQAGFFDSC